MGEAQAHNIRNLLDFPNEVLEEIFSHLYSDQQKVYTWENLIQSDLSGPFDYTKETERIEEPEARSGTQYIRKRRNKARATLFNLRLVCRGFEAAATPLAFSTIHICHSLEHTQRIVRNLVDHENNPFARYTKHIVISPMSILPKACLRIRETALYGKMPTDEAERQSSFDRNNQVQWVGTFKREMEMLFSSLPDSVIELTIGDLQAVRAEDLFVMEANELFMRAFGFTARVLPCTRLQKLNIRTQYTKGMALLWQQPEDIYDVVSGYILPPGDTHYQLPFLENVREINLKSNKITPSDLNLITKWLPKSLEHFFLRCPYEFSRSGPLKFEISYAHMLKSVVLEGIGVFDESTFWFLLKLQNCSKIHLYGSDIIDDKGQSGNSTRIDFRWGHIFRALMKLPKLVDFQAQNLSYTSVRMAYKYFDLQKIWLFTEYLEDFEAFDEFRTTLLDRRTRLGLSDHRWLLRDSIYSGEPKPLPAYGLTTTALVDVFQDQSPVIRTKQQPRNRRQSVSFGGEIKRRGNEMVYLMYATKTYEVLPALIRGAWDGEIQRVQSRCEWQDL
ncbi:hypothetical protein TWF718_005753 [Orbilia javanica]|uniref:F-box domain-containing protein n=1 Tax=Orbilia javanica TaxID=47235 RepID=A0AAN8RJN4_9PEZI